MKKIKAKKLTHENFIRYGTYNNLHDEFSKKEKESKEEFIIHHDVVLQNLGNTTIPAFFTCYFKQGPNIVTMIEAHDTCEEVLIFEQDTIIAVAPPCKKNKPPKGSIEAFFVPRHTIIKYYIGVWHYAPFLPNSYITNTLYCMPQRIWEYDETPIELNADEQVEIIE